MILSFAMTTDAVCARRKRVTRREWTDAHAAKFHVGQVVDAWTKSPHRGGKPFGKIRITHLYKEKTCLIPESDWEDEGFAYMEENGILLGKDLSCSKMWRLWRSDPEKETWVIRFDVLEIFEELAV